MSMTSSSPAEKRFRSLLVWALLLTCGRPLLALADIEGVLLAQQVAPDAPRPARPAVERPPGVVPPNSGLPVELESVSVRRMDDSMAKLAGPEFMKTAANPLYIEVQVRQPLGNLERSAALVILLNDKPLLDTRGVAPDRLVAFLSDTRKLREVNSVAVVWLGDRSTKSEQPLTFLLEDISK
jgi:hypothetical protein